MSKILIAHGVLGWDGKERRSDRYGAVCLAADGFEYRSVAKPTFNHEVANALRGRRVRITAKVIESRPSGHDGDAYLKIKPSQPEVGEEIDLGVGILDLGTAPWDPNLTTVVLQPGDGRRDFWYDPRKLYRLHDQTIDLFIEETTEDFSPRPDVKHHVDPHTVVAGPAAPGGGHFLQTKMRMPTRISPVVEKLGDGLFSMTPHRLVPGEVIPLDESDFDHSN